MPGDHVVIELAGPAGAGKTTLAGALQAADPATGLGLRAGHVRMARALASAAPALAGAWLSAPPPFWSRDDLRSLAYLTAWQRQARLRAGPGLTVLDHGPVFRLASLTVYGPPMADTRAFSRHWCRLARQWGRLLDLVVWLDAPDDVLLTRIGAREQGHRVRGADRAEAAAFLVRYRGQFRTAIAAVADAGARVVELDTTADPPDRLAAMVRAAVLASPGPGLRRPG